MKKRYLFVAALMAIAMGAKADVAINETNFPDEIFRSWLMWNDYGRDGVITTQEIAKIYKIDVTDKGISSLKGIEFFTELDTLACDDNNISQLDLSQNMNLEIVSCGNNHMKNLTFPNTQSLNYIVCWKNDLRGTAIEEMIASLPLKTEGENYITLSYTYGGFNEMNHITPAQAAAFKAKGWLPYRVRKVTEGLASRTEWSEYRGDYVPVSEKFFPDVDFRNFILSMSYGKDKEISDAEITTILSMDLSGRNIYSLQGIEFFTKLTSITFYGNHVKGADMDELIRALPRVSSGELIAVKRPLDLTSDNDITAKQVLAAKAKGWTTYWTDGSSKRVFEGTGSLVDENYFPDEEFRSLVSDIYDIDHDGFLSTEERDMVKSIEPHKWGYNKIEDFTGIELFTNLQELDYYDTPIKIIDLSKNTQLTSLSLPGTELKTINVTSNTLLTVLNVAGNDLSYINVANNKQLKTLCCSGNRGIATIDLSNNTALEKLDCSECSLGWLDVSKNTMLKELKCHDNQMKGLTMVQGNSAIELLRIDLNQIRGNDMYNFYKVMPEVQGEHKLCVYNEKENPVTGNKITPEQVSWFKTKGWTVMMYKQGNYVEFDGVDPGIAIDRQNFPDANFRQAVEEIADTDKDGFLDDVERSLKRLNVYNRRIVNLKGIEYFGELENLSCHFNDLSSVDLSSNRELKTLEINNNELTSLYLNDNWNLEAISCHANQLKTLDLSDCPKLNFLQCYDNKIHDKGMDDMVESLPTVKVDPETGLGGILYVADREDSNGNHMTRGQVAKAKEKGWTVYAMKEWDGQLNWDEYEGEDPTNIAINDAYFPDEDFRSFLLSQDFGSDAMLTPTEISTIYELNVSGKGISSLKGIEFFTNLIRLDCSGNNLTALNVSKNTKLSNIDVSRNNIGIQAMGQLVASLPEYDIWGSRLVAVYLYRGYNEKNIITEAQVAQAKAKFWKVGAWDYDRYFEDLAIVDYSGSIVITPYGDVNGDFAVDVADISSVISVMAGTPNVSAEQADVNQDGTVDVADISKVITIMAENARRLNTED